MKFYLIYFIIVSNSHFADPFLLSQTNNNLEKFRITLFWQRLEEKKQQNSSWQGQSDGIHVIAPYKSPCFASPYEKLSVSQRLEWTGGTITEGPKLGKYMQHSMVSGRYVGLHQYAKIRLYNSHYYLCNLVACLEIRDLEIFKIHKIKTNLEGF